MNIQLIIKILEQENYKYYALRRVSGESFKVGDHINNSRRWFDGNPIHAYAWIDENEIEHYISQGYEVIPNEDAEGYAQQGYWRGSGEILVINYDNFTEENGTWIAGSLQKYCPDCSPCALLEIDAVQGIEYYKHNKEKLNPKRNEKRRVLCKKQVPCEVCKQLFHKKGGAVACPSCRPKWRKLRQKIYDSRRRA